MTDFQDLLNIFRKGEFNMGSYAPNMPMPQGPQQPDFRVPSQMPGAMGGGPQEMPYRYGDQSGGIQQMPYRGGTLTLEQMLQGY